MPTSREYTDLATAGGSIVKIPRFSVMIVLSMENTRRIATVGQDI
jgi:hypothetical protein